MLVAVKLELLKKQQQINKQKNTAVKTYYVQLAATQAIDRCVSVAEQKKRALIKNTFMWLS